MREAEVLEIIDRIRNVQFVPNLKNVSGRGDTLAVSERRGDIEATPTDTFARSTRRREAFGRGAKEIDPWAA